MAKILIAACAALILFSAVVAKPLSTKDHKKTIEEIINKLHDLKPLPDNTPFVPKLLSSQEKRRFPSEINLPIEVIACRGVKSLTHLSGPEKEQFASLNRSLAILSHGVKCTVNPEESYDAQSFLNELLSVVQYHFTKLYA